MTPQERNEKALTELAFLMAATICEGCDNAQTETTEETKPEQPKKELGEEYLDEYIYNVWLGASVRNPQWIPPEPASPEPVVPPVPKNYLEQALLVSGAAGARGNTYGTAKENFQRIANLWNAQLGLFNGTATTVGTGCLTRPLTSEDVSILMVLVKLSRLANCPTHVDSWVDIAGYVNCASQIQQGE